MKILSLPSRHPCVSKFHTGRIKFVNPDTDLFSSPEKYSSNYLDRHYPPNSYDLVHIHFSFDKLPLAKFQKLLKYFRTNKKPIVWTCHSKESQRIKNLGGGQYQRLLFEYADQIISPTCGCIEWLKSSFGEHKNEIKKIPLGFMADPKEVHRIAKNVKKDKNTYVMLIGDFRENKEVIQSIINLLQCSKLKEVKLQLIYKPINLYPNGYEKIEPNMLAFYSITQNSRITSISLPEISNNIITQAFLASHAVILPYKWGTHSGQIELARDCGCHVVVPNVGYYKEQWDKVHLWDTLDENYQAFPKRYTTALIKAHGQKSLKPAGKSRFTELSKIYNDHLVIYNEILSKNRRS